MQQQQTILVTGATGAQGGSVAKALLEANKFSVRILTRNPLSAQAMALKKMGAEVVTGDMDDINSLRSAMKDCYGVFGLTNYWEHFEKEYQQGKNLIDAVHEMGIRHFVLHTLPDHNKLSNGKYPTPHCDNKAALQRYTKSLGIAATFVQVAYYYENFFSFFQLQHAGDGSYYFGFPQGDTKLAMISVEDVGGIVATVFDHPLAYTGRTVGAVGAHDTCDAYAAIFTRVLGKTVRYNYIPRDIYAAFEFPGAAEIANMFEVQRLYIPDRQLDLIESYGLNPAILPFEKWVEKNAHSFMMMMHTPEVMLV